MQITDYTFTLEQDLNYYLNKYMFGFVRLENDCINLRNKFIKITISYRFDEFSLCIYNSKGLKTLNEFVFQKYPDYINLIKVHPDIDLFKKKEEDFSDFGTYLGYLTQNSFDFLETNFPEAFEGKF